MNPIRDRRLATTRRATCVAQRRAISARLEPQDRTVTTSNEREPVREGRRRASGPRQAIQDYRRARRNRLGIPWRTRWNEVSRSARHRRNRQKFQRAGGLAPCSPGVVPSDDRRLTVLHRREGRPSSIYFAPTSLAGATPRPFAEGNISASEAFFRTEETPLGGDARADAKRPNCAYA